MGILDGKRILITGVLTDASLAFGVAKLAQEQGAEIVLSSFGRVMSLTQRAARRLPTPPEIIQLDVADGETEEIFDIDEAMKVDPDDDEI